VCVPVASTTGTCHEPASSTVVVTGSPPSTVTATGAPGCPWPRTTTGAVPESPAWYCCPSVGAVTVSVAAASTTTVVVTGADSTPATVCVADTSCSPTPTPTKVVDQVPSSSTSTVTAVPSSSVTATVAPACAEPVTGRSTVESADSTRRRVPVSGSVIWIGSAATTANGWVTGTVVTVPYCCTTEIGPEPTGTASKVAVHAPVVGSAGTAWVRPSPSETVTVAPGWAVPDTVTGVV
jgi:hypothetical protein